MSNGFDSGMRSAPHGSLTHQHVTISFSTYQHPHASGSAEAPRLHPHRHAATHSGLPLNKRTGAILTLPPHLPAR